MENIVKIEQEELDSEAEEDLQFIIEKETRESISVTKSETRNPVDMYLPEPRSLNTMLKLPEEIKEEWLQSTKYEIMNLINNHTFNLK